MALNRDRHVTSVCAGDFLEAHRVGCDSVRAHAMAPVDGQFDIVITSNSGTADISPPPSGAVQTGVFLHDRGGVETISHNAMLSSSTVAVHLHRLLRHAMGLYQKLLGLVWIRRPLYHYGGPSVIEELPHCSQVGLLDKAVRIVDHFHRGIGTAACRPDCHPRYTHGGGTVSDTLYLGSSYELQRSWLRATTKKRIV